LVRYAHKIVAVSGARVLVAKIRTASADKFGGIIVRGALFRIAITLTTKIGFLSGAARQFRHVQICKART